MRLYGVKNIASLDMTLAQAAVACKRSEITAVPALLNGRDLSDTIITSDALLTQRSFAEQVSAQGGYYFMMVKANQPQLRDDLALFFELPAIRADNECRDRVETLERAHGRLERRCLESLSGDCAFLGWPGATHLVRRTCERQVLKTYPPQNRWVRQD